MPNAIAIRLLGMLAACSGRVEARVVLEESFRTQVLGEPGSGYAPGSLWGQSVGGSGFGAAPWNGTERYRMVTLDGSLKSRLAGLHPTGGKAWWDPNGDDACRVLQRPLAEPSSGDVYFSVILHPGWTYADFADTNGWALVGLSGGLPGALPENLESLRGDAVLVGFTGDHAEGVVDLVLVVATPTGPPERHTVARGIPAEDVLIACRVAAGEDGERRVRYWVDPWNVETESQATDTASLVGEVVVAGGASRQPLDRVLFLVDRYDRKLFVDEIRVADSVADLAGGDSRMTPRAVLGFYASIGTLCCFIFYATVWRAGLCSASATEGQGALVRSEGKP